MIRQIFSECGRAAKAKLLLAAMLVTPAVSAQDFLLQSDADVAGPGNVAPNFFAQSFNPSPDAGELGTAILGVSYNDDSDDDSEDKATIESLSERLAELEAAYEEDAEAADKKKSDAAKKPSLKINGRIHLDYWNYANSSDGIGFFEHQDATDLNFGNGPEDRVFFRRIRLKFDGNLFDTMLYRMQIDFNAPSGGEMKDMFIGFTDLPMLGTVLVGNQKRPMGMDHLNSSRFNIFIERPLVVEAFNEDARRLGITSYNGNEEQDFNWAYGIYALENLTRDGKIIGDSMQLSGNARMFGSPWYDETSGGRGYFHWGLSGMLARPDGDNDGAIDTNSNEGRFRTRGEIRSDSRWIDTGRVAGADWYETIGLEAMLNIGAFHAAGEFQSNWMQRDTTTVGTGPDLNFHGGYFHVAYMLTGEHMPYKRKSGTIDRIKPFENFFRVDKCDGCVGRGSGAWQVALRYSYLDLTDNDVLGGVETNVTGGLVWYLNPYSSMQFNAVYGDIRDRAPIGGFSDGTFTALGTRFRVDF